MIAVSSASSSAAAALKLISTLPSEDGLPNKAAPGLNPISARSISPGVSDALLKIAEIVNEQSAKAHDDGYVRGALTKISDLPASHAERLRALGADAAVRVTAPEISDEAFQGMMLEYGKENWGHLKGFSEALENGTLKIQRASDVPELGLGYARYDLHKNGNMIGGAIFAADTFNKALYLEIQAQGIRQATGSVNGHNYYVTWADPSLAAPG